MTKDVWRDALTEAHKVLHKTMNDEKLVQGCQTMATDIVNAFNAKKKILICGNGGSHCDANHFAEEFTGRFRKDRKALPVLALGEAAHTTCVGNDYGFEKIFSRQIEALGAEGDILIVLSTSGESANVLEALKAAKSAGLKTWALLGKGGGRAVQSAANSIVVPGETTDRIQEIHMLLLHITIEQVERSLFPANYA